MRRTVVFSYVLDKQEPIEHELIRTGTLVEFEIIDTRIEPTAAGDDCHVHLTLQIPKDDLQSYAFALVYVLGLLSFHDGRPRGYSARFFDDEWRAADMLRHLEFRRGRLYFDADYVRGRCFKTTLEVTRDGIVTIETVNRGEAAVQAFFGTIEAVQAFTQPIQSRSAAIPWKRRTPAGCTAVES